MIFPRITTVNAKSFSKLTSAPLRFTKTAATRLAQYKHNTSTVAGRAFRSLKCIKHQLVPFSFDRFRVKEIDLTRVLIGGENGFDGGRWAELTGNLKRASQLLKHAPHVELLEHHRLLGDKLFLWKHFEKTPYFRNAVQCVRIAGDYFGQRSPDGIRQHAQSFVTLFKRVSNGDRLVVSYPSLKGHSPPRSLPVVCKTLTHNTFQIIDGLHRLAIDWVLGMQKTKAVVLPPKPTELQSLALRVAQTRGRKELYQPFKEPEFDETWNVVRKCSDRFSMMLGFLSTRKKASDQWTFVDLACSSGWFVGEFLKRGYLGFGIDRDSTPVKMGRISYELTDQEIFQCDLEGFLENGSHWFDIVILLSILHHYALSPDFGKPEKILAHVDRITGKYLFLDMGQNHEDWFRGTLQKWDSDFIIRFIKRHTSFNTVLPLGTDTDDSGHYQGNYGRTLFVCFRK